VRWLGALGLIAIAAAGPSACSSRAGHSRARAVEVVQTTASLSQRLTRLPDLRFGTGLPRGVAVIHVDDTVRYQRIVGVGAALTDTSAWLLYDELPAALRGAVIRDLFGPAGIHLVELRLPIGASDFTKDGVPYSYDDVPPGRTDPSMSRFSIAHDDAYIVPMLRQIVQANPRLVVLASPWSPPAWMKANGSLGNRADLGTLLPAAYGPLARYFVDFVQAYARRGLHIAAVTAQNEPGQQGFYPGLNLPERAEATFISRDLAPALRAAGLSTKIYAHDFKWLFSQRVMSLVSNPALARAIAGIAWHCYDGNPSVMTGLHRVAPGLDQIESECSTGGAPGPPAELMIAAFRNWATGVLLWNLALDPRGGPVEPPNLGCPRCVGVVTIDERTHAVVYGSDYYQLGQFSKFVRPGASRIGSDHFVAYNTPTRYHHVDYATAGIDDAAFTNPDGGKVLLAHNTSNRPRRFAVQWRGRAFTYTLPAGATVTFLWS
jgi:glucosylceramidase